MLQGLQDKHFDRWIGGYLAHATRSLLRKPTRGLRHLLVAVCDHFEPLWQNPPAEQARARVQRWVDAYPRMAAPYRDADGRAPQHTFFFPGEEYQPEFFVGLEQLVRAGYGEVELHLHHEDTSECVLRRKIEQYVALFAARGHLPRTPSGQARYAFIHGNWALANARPDGRGCGIDAELPLLFASGCYADFTFPSAPDVSQPNIVNQIYWPVGELARRRAYEFGQRARVDQAFDDRILLIQGPLALTRRAGSLRPRIDYAALTAADPPTPSRVRTWVQQNIHVEGRPEWVFVKLHTHGAQEAQAEMLLSSGSRALHEALARGYNDGVHWKLHYVTAREMYNVAKAAMAGEQGDAGAYRDYELPPPPISPRSSRTVACTSSNFCSDFRGAPGCPG